MKHLVTLVLLVTLITGCSSIMGGGPAVATRILAGLTCVAALAQLGAPLATDPDLGVSTAVDAFNAVQKITDAGKLAVANSACAETLAYAVEDLKGAVAMVQSKPTTPATAEPPAQRKARLSKDLPKAQSGPVKVQVPLK